MTQFCALFLDIYALLAHQIDSVFLRANMLSFDCMDFAFFCIYCTLKNISRVAYFCSKIRKITKSRLKVDLHRIRFSYTFSY